MVPADPTEAEMQLAPPLEIPASTLDANKMATSRAEVPLLDQEAGQSTPTARSPTNKFRTALHVTTSKTTPPPLCEPSEIGDSFQGSETMHNGGDSVDITGKAAARNFTYGKKNGRVYVPSENEDDSRSTPRQHNQDEIHNARHPSDEKYRLLKRKLKEVLEELGSDSSQETFSSMDSDSELSDGTVMGNNRSRKSSPIRGSVLSSPQKRLQKSNKDVDAPSSQSKDVDAPSSQSTRHPKKPTSQTLVHKSPVATTRKELKEASTPSSITNVGSATQKPKRIHNSGRYGPSLSKIRKVQHVERDEEGHIKFPLTIGIITLMDIGRVVFDREAFHTERYIWPVGYKMSRSYNSMVDPTKLTTYTCSFQIDAEDQPDKPIIAGTATGAWTHVVKTANQIRRREHSNSASGPDYFGFSNATVAKLIQDLPNVDKCTSYILQRFEEPMKEPTPLKDDDITLTNANAGASPDHSSGPMLLDLDNVNSDMEQEMVGNDV
ncbi:hypothetical protein BGZ70_007447 [Mortierella alpina]|uniref:FYR N-terminal domain-containing protein n=1 Tax=Mortierella alpina TaxID=64518 RepID=A0A9P6J6H6_MORAP|nr:hypothetical protein BGZ70_007447 [Mortierella alpina]